MSRKNRFSGQKHFAYRSRNDVERDVNHPRAEESRNLEFRGDCVEMSAERRIHALQTSVLYCGHSKTAIKCFGVDGVGKHVKCFIAKILERWELLGCLYEDVVVNVTLLVLCG